MEEVVSKLDRYFKHSWRLGVLDNEKGLWTLEPSCSTLAYLRAENANGRHILMQPLEGSSYLLADDLSPERIAKQHRLATGAWRRGRMVVETSAGNYQVWIHTTHPLSLEDKRHWLSLMGSDPGADPNNRWGRAPGFRNRKQKHKDHRGGYPLARLIWVDWKTRAHVPGIQRQPGPSPPLSPQPPVGAVCHRVCRSDYHRADESATDFAYALALARRGCTDELIKRSILSERQNWDNHRGDKRIQHYLSTTLRRVRSIVA